MRGQRMRHKIANREGRAFEVCLPTFRTGEYVGEIEGSGIERIGRRVQDWDGVRLVFWKESQGFGWGMGPLANKVWGQPESLAGSAPRSCGHEDLSRILRPQVVGISDAAQEGSVCKQQQSGRRSCARVHSEARGDDRGPGVRIPGADVGQRWSR